MADKSLIERNSNKTQNEEANEVLEKNFRNIDLPFILFSTDSKTNIDCCISGDKYVKLFIFL